MAKNLGFKIKEVWAYVAVNPEDSNDEGIIGMQMGGVFMPFVAADRARMEQLRPHAIDIAKSANTTVKLIRLSVREDVETIFSVS